ncbi:ABC transporter ATP-binding protein [Nocardioides humi]|uniref:ABC transporter domain-containing protein n=1 Tax=Nocardioides humi TaxID=449461 RepID=A0ABN1ZW86_9ACTN|nr:ATP-binding cassette domain-containing protein [Nocardioides humi]
MSKTSDPSAFPPVFEARDVAVHFGGIRAVDGISFELTSGKIFGVLGPNGSGKSTLLGAMTGLVHLTSGSFEFHGSAYAARSAVSIARGGVARTFQTVRLVPSLTVHENIQLAADQIWTVDAGDGAPLRGSRRRRAAARQVAHAMELTGTAQIGSLRPSELSYGTQRRVEIARAIAARPKLLLLDEPTAGMNKHERREIGDLLRSLRAEGLTQLLVEHDVDMMVETCDHLFAMNSGRLIAEGTPAEVVRDPLVEEAYLGRKAAGDATRQ